MDEKCFQKYLQLIEPGIQNMIRNYFGGWSSIESSITQIIMRENKVYKTHTSIIFDKNDDRTKFSDLVDLEKYKKFEKFNFKKKLDILFENKIIGTNTHQLLDHLRLKRNSKIHGTEAYFTDEDREWFEIGYSVIHTIYFASSDKLDPVIKNRMCESAENTAALILKKIT
ncbi:MAG: hypothetical protein EPO37_07400 [Nitrosarchaeum sp.]|nr:MAG: hypothetical protein EPO37_07400 [Nitrosarchaeum sp.]